MSRLDFDLRRVVKVVGFARTFGFVMHRLALRHK